MLNLSNFQTFLSLGVEQGLQKLPKFDINYLKLLFYCYILIPRKCPHKTPFKAQCPPVHDWPQKTSVQIGLIKEVVLRWYYTVEARMVSWHALPTLNPRVCGSNPIIGNLLFNEDFLNLNLSKNQGSINFHRNFIIGTFHCSDRPNCLA